MKRIILFGIILILLVSCVKSEEIEEIIEIENTHIITQEDETMLITEEVIIQESKPKEVKQIYKISKDIFNNEVNKELIKEETISQGQPTIKKVGTKEIKEVTKIVKDEKLEIIIQQDPNLEYQEEVILQEGVLGEKEVTIEETYVKGLLKSSKQLNSIEIVKAEPKIISTNSIKPEIVYDNTDLSWWYIPESPKARIPSEIETLIRDFNVLWQIPTDEKVVYLTFDEGYEFNNNTSKILDLLKKKNVQATFFVTGSYVDNNPELIQRMIDEGHQIGNHTVNHYRAAVTIQEDKQKYINDIIHLQNKVPEMTMLHRPPEGGYSQESLSILDELGYTTVFWSFAYRDWLTDDQPDPREAFNTITNNLHPGSIILLHPVSDTNTLILEDVIDEIFNQGYEIGILKGTS